MSVKILAAVISFGVLIFVIDLIRREKMTFKYGVGWIFLSALGVFFALFEKTLFKLAFWMGFELPSNFIFFTLLSVFVVMSLFLTIFLCHQNSRNDEMAQKIALMEFEIENMKKEKTEKDLS